MAALSIAVVTVNPALNPHPAKTVGAHARSRLGEPWGSFPTTRGRGSHAQHLTICMGREAILWRH